MKINLSKSFFYQFLFAISVWVTYLNNYELTFGVWTIALFFSVRKTYSSKVFEFIIPFIGILSVSIIVSFFYNNTLYNAIRDFTYLIKPILGILLGYQLYKTKTFKLFETIVIVGLFIAVIHLGLIGFNILINKTVNMNLIRAKTGFFSDFEIYALIVILFNKQFELKYSKNKIWLLGIILLISSFLYFSRTNFIQFGVLFVALKGYLKFTKKSILVLSTLVFFTLTGYAYIYNMELKRNGKGLEALLFKIKNAPIEPFKTKINKDDYQDFNDNYRSFENITTVKQVSKEGLSAIFFGKGLGATIDLGRKVMSNDREYVTHQPILHNAYMTVYLKSGLIGVFFMFLFLYQIMRKQNASSPIIYNAQILLFATGVYLIVANWVLLGLFLKIDNKSIIIGLLLSFIEYERREQKLLTNA